MENRKIMIEVTEEEYEKIKNGQLEIDIEEEKKQAINEVSITDLVKILHGKMVDSMREKTTYYEDQMACQCIEINQGKIKLSDNIEFEYFYRKSQPLRR